MAQSVAMPITSSQGSAMAVPGANGAVEEGLAPDASFRRKYGIPPGGDRTAPDSAWGFPMPPPDHPDAKSFARAVLSRAHQAGNFKPEDVAKQVRKANRVLHGTANPTDADKAKSRESARTAADAAMEALHAAPAGTNAKRLAHAAAIAAFRDLDDDQLAECKEVPLRIGLGLREVRLSADSGVARSIIITEGPGNLADKHYYTKEALAQAVEAKVFEGAQCYLDHPTPTQDREQPERSVHQLGGFYSDVQLSEVDDPKLGRVSAIFADLNPAVGNAKVLELLRTSVVYAQRYPDKSYVGLSINAVGSGQKAEIDGEIWNRVDCIAEVVSVDIVTKAGARGKPIAFREAARMAARTSKDLRSRVAALNPVKLTELAQKSLKRAIIKCGEADKARKLYREAMGLDADEFAAKLKESGVDGAAMSKLLDDLTDSGIENLTGVHPDSLAPDDEEEDARDVLDDPAQEDDEMEDDFGDGVPGDGPRAGGSDGGAPFEEDDVEAEEAKIDKMPEAKVRASLKRSRASERAANKKVRSLERELSAAKTELREAKRDTHRNLLEQATDRVLEDLKIPENFRPRIKREIRESAGVKTVADVKAFVREFDLAYVRNADGTGSIARESGASKTAAPSWKRT